MSLLEWTLRNKRILQQLKEENPSDLQALKEEGYEAVWFMPKSQDPWHTEGFAKTRHDDERDA